MRYAPFNCAKVFLIFCPFAEQEPGCCLSNGCYQNQRSDYWWFRKRVHICGESPCDLSSCSKHRAAFRDRYSTVHRFVNVFFKILLGKGVRKNVTLFFRTPIFSPKKRRSSRLTSRCLHQSQTGSVSSAYHNSPDCRFRQASVLPQYFHFDRLRLWSEMP